jgi:prepilin-type N-terminal cleavage/methylation domain-containing protein
MKQKQYKNGFSLIELLVVLGIVAVLTSLVAFNFNTARARARDVTRKSDLNSLKGALELYRNDNNGKYPNTTSYVTLLSTYLSEYVSPDIGDPKISQTGDATSWEEYQYTASSPYLGYTLTVCLENRSDDMATGNSCGPSNKGKFYPFEGGEPPVAPTPTPTPPDTGTPTPSGAEKI